MSQTSVNRQLGLFQATGIGVGAIVGGGILALAGVAFANAGPGAILAFALNGVIALITAVSFAELSTAFPESGGPYTYAKKILSVQSAFVIGWMVWFASLVAAVLYALGFGAFAGLCCNELFLICSGIGFPLLTSRPAVIAFALAAVAVYTANLMRTGSGGGQWISVSKVVVFGVLIAAGIAALARSEPRQIQDSLSPFLTHGFGGVVQAMGYTFIALQGFDLIAAVAGEIRDPAQTIPRAMILSLGIALGIYIPLLFIISTVGVKAGESIANMGAAQPEAVVAAAAENYLGTFGYWLVLIAAILSMLSALHANLYAASRVALTMARDRTLPHALAAIHTTRGTPAVAVGVGSATVMVIVTLIPDIASAGAASSLIFLLTFALVHGICILNRIRSGITPGTFLTPFFPLLPIAGIVACTALALFQGTAVPSAGMITLVWTVTGAGLFWFLFAQRARVVDASAEALDPQLLRLRGRSPLVLVPIANPDNAQSMVTVAHALTPRKIGRILMMTVVALPDDAHEDECNRRLLDAQNAVGRALAASLKSGLAPEALTTVADDPWKEIVRVAQIHHCESLLLGFSKLSEEVVADRLEHLISAARCDVVVLRAPVAWRLGDVRRVLVPVGGRSEHKVLRARLLGSLVRTGSREITFLRVVPANVSDAACHKIEHELAILARDEVTDLPRIRVVRNDSFITEVVHQAQECDLIVLGLRSLARNRRVFGDIALSIIRETHCGVIMISQFD